MIEIIRNWKKKRQDRKQAQSMRSYLWNWQKWSIRDEQNYYKGKEKDSYGIQRGKIGLQSQK